MFSDQLLAGRRILVTGGGTGLGKAMATKFLQLGAEVHICGRRKAVCDETATELMGEYGGRVVSHGLDISNAHCRRRDDRGDLDRRSAHRPHQQCGRQFRLAHAGSVAARFRCGGQHRDARHVLCDACGGQALDRRRASRQCGVDHRDLGAQRQPVRGAVGHEQVGDPCHDDVAGGGMGTLRHPPQHDRARRDPDRGHEQAAQSRTTSRARAPSRATRWAASAGWRSWRTSPCS